MLRRLTALVLLAAVVLGALNWWTQPEGADEGLAAPVADPAVDHVDDGDLMSSQASASELATPPVEAFPADAADADPESAADGPRTATPVDVIRQLPDFAEATFFGGMHEDVFLGLALDAIACVADRPADRVERGLAIYEYPASDGASMSLVVSLEDDSGSSDFTLSSVFPSNPGWVTGCVDDQARESSVELHVDFDEAGGSATFGSVARSRLQQTSELSDYIESMGRPVPHTGLFRATSTGASWRQATVTPVAREDGEAAWHYAMGPEQSLDFALDDPRVAQVASGVKALRRLNLPVGDDG